jgi:hypothetical protein
MLNAGSTFLLPTPPRYDTKHLWVVLAIIADKTLAVNVTSKTLDCDMSCMLRKGDHNFILHDSIINYADAMLMKSSELEAVIKANGVTLKDPVSYRLLSKIKAGAKVSDAFPTGLRDLLFPTTR